MKKELIRTTLENGMTVVTEETESWYITTVSFGGEVVYKTGVGGSLLTIVKRHSQLVAYASIGEFGSYDMRPKETTIIGKLAKWLDCIY